MLRLAGLVLLLLLGGCPEMPPEPLRIGTNLWPGYGPLYLARDLGLLRESEFRLVEYSNNSQSLNAFRNGLIDAAALTLDEALLLLENGLEPRVVLVMDISAGGDALVARPGLDGLAALAGKRVGVENTALGSYMLSRALEHAGLRPADIVPVPLTVDRHAAAYLAGEVDAVVTFEPVLGQLLAAGGRVLFDSSRIPGEIVDVLVVRRAYLARYPARVRALLGHWLAALAYLREHPEDAARRLAERPKLAPEAVLASHRGLIFPDRAENRRLLLGKPEAAALPATARQLAQTMRQASLLRRPLASDGLFDAAPVLWE